MTQEVPARAVSDAPNRCRDRERVVEKIVYRDRETPALAKPPAASVPKLPAPTTAGALVPAREAPVPRMVGLGLALERVSGDPTTYVQEIIPGFAAHRSAQFELHDILLSIDNEPVPPPHSGDARAVQRWADGHEARPGGRLGPRFDQTADSWC